jgi:RNA polymerase sigma factor for flagellar operon FliA
MADDDRFIEEYRPLVHSIAQKLRTQLDLQGDPEDLAAYGFRGLLEARSRYDASRGVQFNTFAYYRIRGAILDGVRKMAWLPRRTYDRARSAEATDQVTEPLGAARGAAGPAARLEDTLQTLDDALGRIAAAHTLATSTEPSSDSEHQGRPDPEEQAIGGQDQAQLREALATLPERERALIEGFYFEDRRFDEVAQELGISKSWASRLHSKALDRLRNRFDSG